MPAFGGGLIMYPKELELSKNEILSKYGNVRMRPNLYLEGYFAYDGNADRNVRVHAKFKPTIKDKSFNFVDFQVAHSLSELDQKYDLYDVQAHLYGAKS